ncbi:MAG: DUF2063 domain-containing protein [Polyangiaceae bacterium]|jgi:hypothetical protein
MSESEAALERALADACLSTGAAEAVAQNLRSYLKGYDVPAADIEAIVEAPQRIMVYRALVRNSLWAVVIRMLGRVRAHLDAACPGRFDADFAEFVGGPGPRSHYLRDVAAELFAWAEPRWRTDGRIPPYVPDLAAHDLACFSIAASKDLASFCSADVSLGRAIAFHPSARLVRYEWAVHELPTNPHSTKAPARRDVRLLGYRDAEHAVRWLELTPLAASIAHRLFSGDALGRAVQEACRAHGACFEPEAIATLLADLGARGVLVGARMVDDR